MSYTDFLGNTIEVGDLIIYSPKGGEHGELVLAEVLNIKEVVKDRWGYPDGDTNQKYQMIGTYINYKPTLRAINSTSSYRMKYQQRDVRLQDMSSTMLYKKADS